MDAKQEQVFRTETARTVNLITATLRDCFNWHLENEGEDGVASVEEVLQSKVDFAALANFGAKLVMQHTGKRIVFIKASSPLSGWMPETMMFLVPPDRVQVWKEQIVQGLALASADLLDELAEMTEEGSDERTNGEADPETVALNPSDAEIEASVEGGSDA